MPVRAETFVPFPLASCCQQLNISTPARISRKKILFKNSGRRSCQRTRNSCFAKFVAGAAHPETGPPDQVRGRLGRLTLSVGTERCPMGYESLLYLLSGVFLDCFNFFANRR
jgi:hypothetical protein